MDINTIAQVAGSVITVLLPFFNKAGESIAEKAGEEVYIKSKELFHSLKNKLEAKPEIKEAILAHEKNPANSESQNKMLSSLKKAMSEDDAFALELKEIINQKQAQDVSAVFINNITGSVQKQVQVDINIGDINL